MIGFLNICKPSGISSRHVVDRVQKTIRRHLGRRVKVGHAGTLDPMADGVMVLGVGKATSLVRWLLQGDKRYSATFLLGKTSDSDDTQTKMTTVEIPESISQELMKRTVESFVGEINQVPPMYSALHVDGTRAYKLARSGQKFELPTRKVQILDIKLSGFQFPSFQTEIHCSGGTYVRSIGRDIGMELGTGAVMSQLTRTAANTFKLDQSIDWEDAKEFSALEKGLYPPVVATYGLPKVELEEEEWIDHFANGLVTYPLAAKMDRFWDQRGIDEANPEKETALVSRNGSLVGVVKFHNRDDQNKRWNVMANFAVYCKNGG